jgi:hypothetical protein
MIGHAKSKLNDDLGLHTNTIVLTDHSLARGDFVVTAEGRLGIVRGTPIGLKVIFE